MMMVEAQETQATPRTGSGRARWYIVHAYSNFEQKVAEAIRDQAGRQGLEEQFEDIQVPTEEVTEVVRGAKKVRQHRHFPGYVLVKMVMSDEAYHLVKNTPKVTGFLGQQNKPQPVSDKEVQRILGMDFAIEMVAYILSRLQFEVILDGDTLHVTWTVTAKDDKPKHAGGIVSFTGVCKIQDGTTVAEATAKLLVKNGCFAVSEGANMPTDLAGVHIFKDAQILYAPGKAANAGGVAVSGLEMSQNSERRSWKESELQQMLRDIMDGIHKSCLTYGDQGGGYIDYVKGANIAGFKKVADAMLAFGVV